MPFWKNDNKEEADRAEAVRKEREQATLEALRNGQVPPLARERIERQKAIGVNFFTSDLSAREFLLCQHGGFQTLGQVMGTSFYNVSYFGFFTGRFSMTGELTAVTEAQLEARRLAMSRLKHEASLLGASGVIGVKIKMVTHDWSSRQTEFTAIGTAIKIPGYPSNQEPFTSDLNGQEFWQLYQAGYLPRGLAFGVCSYYIYTDYTTQQIVGRGNWFNLSSFFNQEVTTYTQGFYHARERAMTRFTDDIIAHGADGSVGVNVQHYIEDIEYEVNDYTYHDLLVHFSAMGTSVAESHAPTEHHQPPFIISNLSDLKRCLAANTNSGVDP